VCDRSAEEGLNLQGGDKVLVHVDLPLDPNRVEQRLGRLDRYGSGDKIPSIVIRYPDDLFRAAWAELLAEGLGVFDRSIASLQYLIDDLMREVRASLLVQGAEAIQSLTERLSGPNGFVARGEGRCRGRHRRVARLPRVSRRSYQGVISGTVLLARLFHALRNGRNRSIPFYRGQV
jgi:hypothetical protein